MEALFLIEVKDGLAVKKEVNMFPASGSISLLPRIFSSLKISSYSGLFGSRPCLREPAVNIASDDNEYVLELSVPGLSKNDVRLFLDDDILEISAEKEDIGDIKVISEEFDFMNFKRSFIIPSDVDSDSIKATCSDGILRVAFIKRKQYPIAGKKSVDVD